MTEQEPINSDQDPYAYLERKQFTSEKFKIEIRGLPKYYGLNEFRKLLNQKLHLKCNKIKPPKFRSSWMYVCFPSEEEKKAAISVLNGYKWKNCVLSVQAASATPDPLVIKRIQSEEENSNRDPETVLRQYKDNVVPFWNVGYDTQLKAKAANVKKTMCSLGKSLLPNFRSSDLKEWLNNQLKIYNSPCHVEDIRHTELERCAGYRNKCEFTIGINEFTKKRAIGFRIATYAKGVVGVGPVNDMPHVPGRMKQVIEVFEPFIQKSELDVFNPELHTGYWRQLTLRHGTATDQLMVVIGIYPQNLTEEQLSTLKRDIVKFFTEQDGKICDVTSLYLQRVARKKMASDTNMYEHLHGSTTVREELCGLKFDISPESFFQVNTAGAEILYNAVRETCSLTPNTTVLDVCCGTGSIGLSLSKHCKQVIGIDSEEMAIENAKNNCQLNNVQNCKFVNGKVEDDLSSKVFANISDANDVVAIIDPPRPGLHQKTIVQLRRDERLNRLVYLSCNPKAALSNFISLGKPMSKTLEGQPFVPLKAIPVDMFPYTKHCELILYFERFNETMASRTVTQTIMK